MTNVQDLTASLVARMHANLVEMWRIIARHCPHGAIEETPGLTLVATGIPYSFFNLAFLTDEVVKPTDAFDHASAFYVRRGLPWQLRAAGVPAAAVAAAARFRNMLVAGGEPGMLLASLDGEATAPAGLDIRAVRDAATLSVFNDLVSEAFGSPRDGLATFHPPALLDAPDVTFYIGYTDGRPVATSSRVSTHRIAGIYDVGVLREYRRRGFGEAMTWRAVLDGRDEGCIAAALQSSVMGYPLYLRMGFERVTEYPAWEPRGGSAQPPAAGGRR